MYDSYQTMDLIPLGVEKIKMSGTVCPAMYFEINYFFGQTDETRPFERANLSSRRTKTSQLRRKTLEFIVLETQLEPDILIFSTV